LNVSTLTRSSRADAGIVASPTAMVAASATAAAALMVFILSPEVECQGAMQGAVQINIQRQRKA
jgi:hypothetical protein